MTHTAERARRGIEAAALATDRLLAEVATMDGAAVRMPSLLPGWSRAHVVTHLARNADALVNLLIWARTGVEHPMYASRDDRDADIEEGSGRGHLVLVEDLTAACQRFAAAADELPDAAWSARLAHHHGKPLPAARVPWLRTREVWMHLIDLDLGVQFDAVPADLHEELLDDVVDGLHGRPDVPPVTVEAELVDGRRRSWQLNGVAGPTVRGPVPDLLAWLSGRGSGAGLAGDLPALPPWA